MDMPTFELITALLPEPVCLLDEDGMLLASNKAARRMLELDAKPSSLFDCVSSEEHAKLKRALQNWVRSPSPLPAAFNFKQSDGGYSKCHVQGSLCQRRSTGVPALIMLRGKNNNTVTGGFRALNDKIAQLKMQIVQRKKTEDDLRQTQNSLQQAQAIAHIGSWYWNLVSNTINMSDEAYRLIGKKKADFIVTLESFTELIHPEDRDIFLQTVTNCKNNPDLPLELNLRLILPDDSIRFLESRGEVIVDESTGRPVNMVGTLHDITERLQAEEKIRQLNTDLERRVEQRTKELKKSNTSLKKSLDELQQTQNQLVESEKMAALGGLVAGIAHEINTPVGVSVTAASHLAHKIKKYARQYQDNNLTREDFELLIDLSGKTSSLILSNLERAANLIRSFKQIAVDQTSDEKRRFNLKKYFSEILLSLEPELKKYQPNIVINCDDSLELNSHPGAISQIFTNLVMNSLIHGFENMEKQQGRIDVNATSTNTQITITYCDNGKGIPAQQAKKIFEPFFTTKRSMGGSGLGMHIVYNLVSQTLEGNIEYQSQADEGACFLIAIPNQEVALKSVTQ